MSFYWYLLLLFIVLPAAYAAVVGAPLLWTRRQGAMIMLREAVLKDGEVAYDLGAGTGRLIVLGARWFGCAVRGIEFAPAIWLLGAANLLLHGIPLSRLRIGDFYRMPFSGIDVFFCFLMPKALARLRGKFERESRRGVRIISYAFPVTGWEAKKVVREKNLPPVYVYEL